MKRPLTLHEAASSIVHMRRDVVSRIMREYGRRGGKKGGPIGGRARMAALSAEERSALARKAALARWGRKRRRKPEA